jgi:hypothetical protein
MFAAVTAVAAVATLAACDDKPAPMLAPTASTLAPAKSTSAEAKKFAIDKDSSKVSFVMEAPREKIRGRVDKTSEGELSIDPSDITKTVGVIKLDLSVIEVFQTKTEKDGDFATSKEEKSDLQNEHVKNWLEINPKDVPEATRKQNEHVEFSIKKIEAMGETNATKLTGAERKVMLKATGDFLLHGRKTEKTAELEATFKYEGDTVKSVVVKSAKPFTVGLEEHDVKPRELFGKLAAKGLDALGSKVAKEAHVSVELTAMVK